MITSGWKGPEHPRVTVEYLRSQFIDTVECRTTGVAHHYADHDCAGWRLCLREVAACQPGTAHVSADLTHMLGGGCDDCLAIGSVGTSGWNYICDPSLPPRTVTQGA